MGAAGGALLAAAGLAWFVAQAAAVATAADPRHRRLVSAGTIDRRGCQRARARARQRAVYQSRSARHRRIVASSPCARQTARRKRAPAPGIDAPPPLALPVNMGLPQTPVPQPRTPTDAPAASGTDTPSAGCPLSAGRRRHRHAAHTNPHGQPGISDCCPRRGIGRRRGRSGDTWAPMERSATSRCCKRCTRCLDEAARKAVLRYEYAPGRRNGIPESAVVRITVSFRLR